MLCDAYCDLMCLMWFKLIHRFYLPCCSINYLSLSSFIPLFIYSLNLSILFRAVNITETTIIWRYEPLRISLKDFIPWMLFVALICFGSWEPRRFSMDLPKQRVLHFGEQYQPNSRILPGTGSMFTI